MLAAMRDGDAPGVCILVTTPIAKWNPAKSILACDTGENSYSSRWKDDHVAENR